MMSLVSNTSLLGIDNYGYLHGDPLKNKVENIEKCRYFEKPLNVKTLTESIFKELEPVFDIRDIFLHHEHQDPVSHKYSYLNS